MIFRTPNWFKDVVASLIGVLQDQTRVHGETLRRILEEMKTMSQAMTDLQAEVAATKSVEASAMTLITSLYQQLGTAVDANDMATVAAITADLKASRASLAQAVVAGTVAAPTVNDTGATTVNDTDPSAPPPASNPGSSGGNVFGSTGPSDPNSQANTSAGAAGTSGAPTSATSVGTTSAAQDAPAGQSSAAQQGATNTAGSVETSAAKSE